MFILHVTTRLTSAIPPAIVPVHQGCRQFFSMFKWQVLIWLPHTACLKTLISLRDSSPGALGLTKEKNRIKLIFSP